MGCYTYGYREEYNDLPKTFGGFAIIGDVVEGKKSVLIKQRNGSGACPYQFDLPGGGFDGKLDNTLDDAAIREAKEEVGLTCVTYAAIGEPLWLPVVKDGVVIRVDGAQAYLMRCRWPSPRITEEALSWAFVHEGSIGGFNVVGKNDDSDPKMRRFGRTPVMIYDGLSVLQEPFYRGPVVSEIERTISESRRKLLFPPGNGSGEKFSLQFAPDPRHDFLLVDDGRYFCKFEGENVCLYYRLNPHEPAGRFRGGFEHLAQETTVAKN